MTAPRSTPRFTKMSEITLKGEERRKIEASGVDLAPRLPRFPGLKGKKNAKYFLSNYNECLNSVLLYFVELLIPRNTHTFSIFKKLKSRSN